MEGLAVLLLGLGAIASAQDAAYRDYHARYGVYQPSAYVAQAETGYAYPPAYVYAPAPAPVIGAVAGGLIGAAAGGAPGAALGMATGGLIGHAATVPQPVPAAPAYYAPARERPAPARNPQSTEQYIQHWQGFMEPAGRR
ncbi:MAG TPA: hypothetical protein VMT02_01030 [Burkholderiales bacterium]|jgi:hypothetical protein|nr:hypothetical protein [Burkholderiales bacterium]